MLTCNWLDLQTLGSQPIMPKNLPNHWEVHPNKTESWFNHLIKKSLILTQNEPQAPIHVDANKKHQYVIFILFVFLCATNNIQHMTHQNKNK